MVLELAWRKDLMSFAMPFMIQCFREFDEQVREPNPAHPVPHSLRTSTQLKTVRGKLQAQEDAERAQEEAKKKSEQEQQQTDAAFVGTGAAYNPMMARKCLPAFRTCVVSVCVRKKERNMRERVRCVTHV